jgi:hypothetical protein
MTSNALAEIRHSAISACPPFPPSTGDRLAPDMVGRLAVEVEARDDRGDVAGAVHFEVKLFHVGFG